MENPFLPALPKEISALCSPARSSCSLLAAPRVWHSGGWHQWVPVLHRVDHSGHCLGSRLLTTSLSLLP